MQTETPSFSPELTHALSSIAGERIQLRLDELAGIADGGRIGEGGGRLALSPKEKEARILLRGWMEEAGMTVDEQWFGLIGVYPGKNLDALPVGCGSHFDTVPRAGKYDGTFGTVAAIETVRAFHNSGIVFHRPVAVIAWTGEESSRFRNALFGSKGMYHGLSPEALAMRDKDGVSLSEAISLFGYDPADAQRPYPFPLAAFIEPHVEQWTTLDTEKNDIGAIEAIAAPERRHITIGVPLDHHSTEQPGQHAVAITVEIAARGGHSGATPMGKAHRADGLQPAATFLMGLTAAVPKVDRLRGTQIHLAGLDIEGQAINNIPANTRLRLILSGDNPDVIGHAVHFSQSYLDQLNRYYGSDKWEKFSSLPISYTSERVPDPSAEIVFPADAMIPRIQTAAHIIKSVAHIAERHHEEGNSAHRIVGTIGTLKLEHDGRIGMDIDVRGINEPWRDAGMGKILQQIAHIRARQRVFIDVGDPLPGSGSPTPMDTFVTEIIYSSAQELGLKSKTMAFPAGHDTQNVSRAGIPASMIAIPSRNGGISHQPDEYSTPDDLENGARTLAVSLSHLADNQ